MGENVGFWPAGEIEPGPGWQELERGRGQVAAAGDRFPQTNRVPGWQAAVFNYQ